MSAKNTVRLITEDADVRKSLTALFKSAGWSIHVFSSAREYREGLEDHKPYGCLLMDAKSTDSSLETLKELTGNRGIVPIIVLAPHGAVSFAVQALKAGAFDVVEKPLNDQSLIESVRKAVSLFGKLQRIAEERDLAVERVTSLTRRESQVLNLMVQGKPNREIAAVLGISPKTLDIHRSNVMDKIEARTVADLCRAYLLHKTDPAHLYLLS